MLNGYLFGISRVNVNFSLVVGWVKVIDLANKAAADAGFEYTYQEAGELVRPHYPLNPLEVSDAADKGFTIFTLSFAEPRDVKTWDEVINQIVQVAFPTGAEQITTFETVCKALAG